MDACQFAWEPEVEGGQKWASIAVGWKPELEDS